MGKEPTRPDKASVQHNFSFTSETRFWFVYQGTEIVRFVGDDDVFVFINRKLVIDLGGIHNSMSGAANLAQLTGLEVGKTYEAAVFQAERHTNGSSYQLTLPPSLVRSSVCTAEVP